MEVILLERIEKLGQMGDVVSVKPGFARNYLLPQKKAMRATKENRAVFEQHRAQLETVNLERKSEAEAVATKLDGLKVVIVRQASESDQLYGSVTVRDIAQAVTEAGFTVEGKQVQLARPIKTVNLHEVRVLLHPEVIVNIFANVARSEEEAELQAAGLRAARPGDRDADEDEDEDTVGAALDADAGEDGPAAAEAQAGAGETAEESAPEAGSRPDSDG